MAQTVVLLTRNRVRQTVRWMLDWPTSKTGHRKRCYFTFKEDALAYAKKRGLKLRTHRYFRTKRRQGTRAPAPKVRTGLVYFAQSGRTKLTKIGFTSNPVRRLKAFRTGDPGIKFALTLKGTAALEKWLHVQFDRVRAEGEWFRLTQRDLKWVTSGAAVKLFQAHP